MPTLLVPFDSAEVVNRLETAARRGRLPGFERGSAPGAFRADAFGAPFDGQVLGQAQATAGGSQIQLSARLKPRAPVIWWAVLVLTVWPGLPITESMLASLLPQWPWLWKSTVYWYLPLTLPFVPWLGLSATRKSRKAVAESAREVAGKIARELGAGGAGGAGAAERSGGGG